MTSRNEFPNTETQAPERSGAFIMDGDLQREHVCESKLRETFMYYFV